MAFVGAAVSLVLSVYFVVITSFLIFFTTGNFIYILGFGSNPRVAFGAEKLLPIFGQL